MKSKIVKHIQRENLAKYKSADRYLEITEQILTLQPDCHFTQSVQEQIKKDPLRYPTKKQKFYIKKIYNRYVGGYEKMQREFEKAFEN